MSTTTKRDLVDRIAANSGCSRSEVRAIVQRVFELISEDLAAGKRIEFRQFGVFEVRERRARTAKNPRTNVRVEVPSRLTIRFKPGQDLKAVVNGHEKDEQPGVVIPRGEPAGV
jgi:integration host factor subunit beta